MNAGASGPEEIAQPRRPVRFVGWLVGVALLAAAVWAVRRAGVSFEMIAGTIRAAPPLHLVALLALPLVNVVLTVAGVQALTRPRVRVSMGEMTALIGSSWLFNYLPLSPGLVGRVAYLRGVHGLPLATSARIIVESIVCGWLGGALVLLDQLIAPRVGGLPVFGITLPLVLAGLMLSRWSRGTLASAYAVCVALKYLDTVAWAVRYLLIFDLLGHPLSVPQAAAIALVAQASMLIPGIGNGLGLREWMVGVLGAALPAFIATEGFSRGTGLAADLVNRAAELAVALPFGTVCTLWLVRNATVRERSGKGPTPSC